MHRSLRCFEFEGSYNIKAEGRGHSIKDEGDNRGLERGAEHICKCKLRCMLNLDTLCQYFTKDVFNSWRCLILQRQ